MHRIFRRGGSNQRQRLFLFTALLFSLIITSTSCRAQTKERAARVIVGGGCDGCDIIYAGMPQQLNWETAIAAPSEPGERMEISGVIYQADRRTPAANVILYVYHTDATGLYSPTADMSGPARRHGHLRGWMKTNERGEYRFTSIRPAPYPNAHIPAHIHPIVKEAERNEYYIDEFLFADDPELPHANIENRGGSGIIRLSKNTAGVWVGKRDIILGLNIPNYR
jgi:protocatechuate 3,4-dioxygenase, beta subunit